MRLLQFYGFLLLGIAAVASGERAFAVETQDPCLGTLLEVCRNEQCPDYEEQLASVLAPRWPPAGAQVGTCDDGRFITVGSLSRADWRLNRFFDKSGRQIAAVASGDISDARCVGIRYYGKRMTCELIPSEYLYGAAGVAPER
jgi:hypothetical protein